MFETLFSVLRDRASMLMRGGGAGHTLQPTAIVNEAYLRLMGTSAERIEDRHHFLLAAAKAMRHILVDHYRAKNAGPRGGRKLDVDVAAMIEPFESNALDVIALDESLEELGRSDPVMARVVELRFFAGLSMDEISEIVDMAPRTLDRRWSALRVWLHRRVQ